MMRAATPDDVDTVVGMIRAMVVEMATHGTPPASRDEAVWGRVRERVAEAIDKPDAYFRLVQRDGAAIALIEAATRPLHEVFEPRLRLHVSAVYVAVPHRRRGIARRLVESALEWGREQGCVEADLGVLATNPARALYESLGFAVIDVKMVRRL
jgi:GNAT superfamily N-acetyltransferase